MKDIKFRVDEEFHQQLQDLAAREGEPVSTIVRRYVRHGVRADIFQQGGRPDVDPAHEGTGRVR